MTTEIPKRIASDIDDVLLNLKDPLRDYYNRRFGANLQLSHYNNYALDKVWGCTRQEAVQIVDDFYLSPEFKTMQPVQGAMEATSLISLKHEVSAITSRPISMQEQTTESLMQYFGNIFSEIFHNGQYGLQTSGLDKSG
ncbi:MAG TPA: hypothetical protein VMC07_00575, partial [Candidatus Omnitrophota bacterium]|nr:hypothetical protein [Candidatus Omnitrophota bacterium]